jgi:alpha-N-arabinofuranosidase
MLNNGRMLKQVSIAVLGVTLAATAALRAQPGGTVEIKIRANEVAAHVSPALYGLMTEEINFSYDGGLYAELIRNRNFKEDAKEPVHWQLVQEGVGTGSMALDPSTPFNDAIPTSLRLTVTAAQAKQKAGIANEGFWGIPVRPATHYRASFYAKAGEGFNGPLTVSLAANDGKAVYASAQVSGITGSWHKYEVTLTTSAGAPVSPDNRLEITANRPGTIWFSMVSLFPPTYLNRTNGNRPDIMQLLADMKPAFLRFPGGNYLEGNTIETRFDWKKTIGDVSDRPGHMDDAWRYWSSDGMGLAEFLNWCEDLHMQPLLAVYAGYSLRQVRVKAGADLEPYVQDALDEIEYVTGDAKTTWGARRAREGHPAPFRLEYVEVGNEDQFDREPGSYDARFTQFFDAIRAKYPQLKIIATAATTTRTPDVIDEHYYRRSEDEMASHAHDYDMRPRTAGPKIFVGEWATRVGAPTPNMSGALGDAAWMTGMERNSDIVIMSCYAPLFVNVNKDAMQWPTDLIGYNTMSSYGSPGYWAQQMFSANHGDLVLPMDASGIPAREWQPPAGRGRGTQPGAAAVPSQPPPSQQVPLLFFSATRDSKTGTIYLKAVNRAGTSQAVHVSLTGVASVKPHGQAITLAANSPDDTNSIAEPRKLVPAASSVDGLGTDFARPLPPYSITVLKIQAPN